MFRITNLTLTKEMSRNMVSMAIKLELEAGRWSQSW